MSAGRGSAASALALGVMGVAGLGISVYLTAVHYAGIAPVCSSAGIIDCSAVTSSAYSVVPGTSIPVTAPGMIWFAVSTCLAAVALIATRRGRVQPSWLAPAHVLWSVAGMATVLYLVYGEITLRRICEWCTAVHLLVFVSLLLTMARWQTAHAGARGVGDAV